MISLGNVQIIDRNRNNRTFIELIWTYIETPCPYMVDENEKDVNKHIHIHTRDRGMQKGIFKVK